MVCGAVDNRCIKKLGGLGVNPFIGNFKKLYRPFVYLFFLSLSEVNQVIESFDRTQLANDSRDVNYDRIAFYYIGQARNWLHYDSRLVNYERKLFIRLATDVGLLQLWRFIIAVVLLCCTDDNNKTLFLSYFSVFELFWKSGNKKEIY